VNDVVFLDDGAARVECLPAQGFTIASIVDVRSGAEALWRRKGYESAPCRRWLGPAGDASIETFIDVFVGGWFEMFPVVGYPEADDPTQHLHGEVVRLPWTVLERTGTAVEARVALVRRPLILTRRVELAGGVVQLHERVENVSDDDVPYLWGHHPCLSRSTFAGGRIELEVAEALVPAPAHDPEAAVLDPGHAFRWPRAPAAAGGTLDIGLVPEAPDGRLDHACLVPSRGELAVTAPRHGRRFALRWELERFPFLLLWEELGGPGGWPFWHGADTFALEFSTNPGRTTADARARNRIDVLPARQSVATSIEAAWEA
jgi:hypothetical protein